MTMIHVTVRLPEELVEELTREAENEAASVGWVIRRRLSAGRKWRAAPNGSAVRDMPTKEKNPPEKPVRPALSPLGGGGIVLRGTSVDGG